MSPYEIELALHYYYSATDYEGRGEPIKDQTLQAFVNDGLLSDSVTLTPRYRPTGRLLAYVEALCAVPMPVQKWVMP